MFELKKGIAEFIGTFALVFVGAGAVIATANYGASFGLLGVALAHGLVLMAMIAAMGAVSGGHFNPAVTVSLVLSRKQSVSEAVFYIASQLSGAALAGVFLLLLFPLGLASHLGVTDVAAGFGIVSAVALEAILTFFLVWTVLATAVDEKTRSNLAPVAIGLVLTFDILVGGYFTGAAMNPARAFGPALASGFWVTQWVYWMGPLLGAIAAALIYRFVYSSNDTVTVRK